MYITHVPLADFERITTLISNARYGGNVTTEWPTDLHGVRYPRIRVGLRTHVGGVGKTDLAPGARYIGNGRHRRRFPKACWHVFRDVLTATFDEFPQSTCRTALATYRGRENFIATFPATYGGSIQDQPMFGLGGIGSACECPPIIRHWAPTFVIAEPPALDLLRR